MCDATGFRFEAVDAGGKPIAVMGDEVKLADGLKLTARSCRCRPTSACCATARKSRRSEGKAEFEFAVKEPGAYRLEAWLKLDGEWRPWIFANPIYVK